MSTTPTGTARYCVEQIIAGTMDSEKLVRNCLQLIDSSDTVIGAWAHVATNLALDQAMAMDERRRHGRALGALHGIPIGLKDIIDTADMPTCRGSAIYTDRQPSADAAIVEKLREAGAVILGKTVTTELAWMHPSETRNPLNNDYSPGGSSSGSAAAVAAGHVPLSIGSQTGGSVIRPASFNGVFGYKPSRGLVSRRGVLQTSPTLDQLGVFGRDAADVSLLVDVIKGYDAADPSTYLAPRPKVLEGYLSEVPVEPVFVWIDLPYASRYSDSLKAGSEELCEVINTQTAATIERIDAPKSFAALIECHQVIYDYEILRSLETEWTQFRSLLSETAVRGLQRAESRSQDQYDEAMGILEASNHWFGTFFHDYDGILTPSATGIAPLFGNGTGDPVCCLIWTLCGLPCLSMPLLSGENDMPIGIQLVGAYDRDDRMMRTAHWLLEALSTCG